MEDDLPKAPLLSHLEELRKRLIWSLIVVVIGFGISYAFAPEIYSVLLKPLASIMEEPKLIYTNLTEPFLTYIKLSLWAGFMVALPFILVQIWLFIAPALYKNEKKTFIAFLAATPVLFIFGAALAYFVVFPLAWQFLLSFGNSLDSVTLQLEPKISEYLSLSMSIILAFGIAFQLPILILLLAKVGLVNYKKLKSFRRYAIVLITIFAAIITPPDVISMLLLAVPLWILYEVSVFGTKFIKT